MTVDSVERPSTVDPNSLAELSRSVSQAAAALFSAGSVLDTLGSVVGMALTTIEGCDLAGIFLMDSDVLTTPVSTGPAVLEIDAVQHRTGEPGHRPRCTRHHRCCQNEHSLWITRERLQGVVSPGDRDRRGGLRPRCRPNEDPRRVQGDHMKNPLPP